MSKTRFTPWVVLVCMSAVAACTSGDGGTAGNTEFNVIVPNNESSPGVPAPIDITTVEYTINCLGNSNTFLDNNASFADEVQINGNLEVTDVQKVCVGGDNDGGNCSSNQDCQGTSPTPDGTCELPPGAMPEVWQGFMDLSPGPCTAQLRARDGDGEVICTATEPFTVVADTTTKVSLVMMCDVSFQAPVGMLDLDGTFSFNVGNFCPDLFVLNCLDSNPAEQDIGIGIPVAVTQCEVRYRDGDSTCGQNCDPQSCSATPEGIDCVPGPDPGVSTTVTCTNLQIDCDGNPGTTETSCTFTGDQTGALPVGGPIVPSPAAFNVACIPPALGGTPGVVGSCTAVTTDGDIDCNKTKVVEVTCPGLAPCVAAGCTPGVDCAFCDDGNDCTSDVCDDSTGSAVCPNSTLPDGTTCSSAPAPAACESGVCTSQNCTVTGCPPSTNDCLMDAVCTTGPLCDPQVPQPSGTACNSNTGTCDGAGTCVDNCTGVTCDDGNECTADSCDNSTNPGTCNSTNVTDGTSCNAGAGQCASGTCVTPFNFGLTSVPIDMCCNNNALPQQSIIPIQLDVDPGSAVPGGAFTADLTGLLVFPETFLDVAQTVVVGGVQQADLIAAQATVEVRGTGVTGGQVTVPAILPPGTCVVDPLASCTVDADCIPNGSFNPCQNLVTVPTSSSASTCASLDPPGCTVGVDCTKTDTFNLNGFCVTGPLPIPLQSVVGNYTAGPSGDTMLFGWAQTGVPDATVVGGVVTIGAPVFTNPVGPNGVKVNASGLSVAIECIQAIETGDPLTDPVTCGSTPDNLLNGSGVGGTEVYLIP